MKTFFEKLMIQFGMIGHPASGFNTNSTSRKRKINKSIQYAPLSPECYNVRGLSKKAGNVRQMPAP